MKKIDYNSIGFKNKDVDKFKGKFGKDKPTQQNVDFKANAEKRVAENISTGKLAFRNTDTSDQRRKISSLKDPQPRFYVEMNENTKPLKNTLASGGKWDKFLVDSQENTSATTYDKSSGKFVNSQQKMKTLAPSYVDPKGPKTLQGVKSKKKQ
jgi:hypothetical protein